MTEAQHYMNTTLFYLLSAIFVSVLMLIGVDFVTKIFLLIGSVGLFAMAGRFFGHYLKAVDEENERLRQRVASQEINRGGHVAAE